MLECLLEIGAEPPATEEDTERGNVYVQLTRIKPLRLLAPFILAYVGTEVTIGGASIGLSIKTCVKTFRTIGWIVTFTKDERGGGSSSGYISSGFFGGLALGRVILLFVTKKV
jgi:hypothetical protein